MAYQFGSYIPGIIPLDVLSWMMPYLQGPEQGAAQRYLYSNRSALPPGETGYDEYATPNFSRAGTTDQWLASLSKLGQAQMPYHIAGSPEGDWLQGLVNRAQGLKGANSEQQMRWRQDYESMLSQAPTEDMKNVASMMFNPTLRQPEFGSVAPMGTYMAPYRTAGGKVTNPWLT